MITVLKGAQAAVAHAPHVDQWREGVFAAAERAQVRPAVMAAIISRETHGDIRTCDPTWASRGRFIGDGGHGHGVCQIDDRSFPNECSAYRKGDLTEDDMIALGARTLAMKAKNLRAMLGASLPPELVERYAIAAYNTGEGNVQRSIARMRDVDASTTGADYSRDVLEQAAWFEAHGYSGAGDDPTTWSDT